MVQILSCRRKSKESKKENIVSHLPSAEACLTDFFSVVLVSFISVSL